MVSWLECQDSSKHMETWSEVNKIAQVSLVGILVITVGDADGLVSKTPEHQQPRYWYSMFSINNATFYDTNWVLWVSSQHHECWWSGVSALESISSHGTDLMCSQVAMKPFMIQAGYNGSQVSTMDADCLVSQHQSISSHGTDLMCSQLAMKPFMIQAGYNGSQVSTMDADGLVSQHQGMNSNSTDLMCS